MAVESDGCQEIAGFLIACEQSRHLLQNLGFVVSRPKQRGSIRRGLIDGGVK
jgi:hypothetical protein